MCTHVYVHILHTMCAVYFVLSTVFCILCTLFCVLRKGICILHVLCTVYCVGTYNDYLNYVLFTLYCVLRRQTYCVLCRYESFGLTKDEMYLEWGEDNNVNKNISLAQFDVTVELVVPNPTHILKRLLTI